MLLLPGLGNNAADYDDLAARLRSMGMAVQVGAGMRYGCWNALRVLVCMGVGASMGACQSKVISLNPEPSQPRNPPSSGGARGTHRLVA